MRRLPAPLLLDSGHSNPVMKTNVGSYDAGVRFIAGCIVLFLSVNGLGWWGLLGLLPILSAACGFCPLYPLLRVNTAAWEADYERRHYDPNDRYFPPE
jgi:hypothetical protein